jgi:hypothetical protein
VSSSISADIPDAVYALELGEGKSHLYIFVFCNYSDALAVHFRMIRPARPLLISATTPRTTNSPAHVC